MVIYARLGTGHREIAARSIRRTTQITLPYTPQHPKHTHSRTGNNNGPAHIVQGSNVWSIICAISPTHHSNDGDSALCASDAQPVPQILYDSPTVDLSHL